SALGEDAVLESDDEPKPKKRAVMRSKRVSKGRSSSDKKTKKRRKQTKLAQIFFPITDLPFRRRPRDMTAFRKQFGRTCCTETLRDFLLCRVTAAATRILLRSSSS